MNWRIPSVSNKYTRTLSKFFTHVTGIVLHGVFGKADRHRNHWAFKNIPRSRRIAQEVRSRNDEGRRYVDWIHVVEEYEWELWLV